ncbi:hypothetical protein ACFX2A_031673 [Malus domestica]
MVDAVDAKASETGTKIGDLLDQEPGNKPLLECIIIYSDIFHIYIPQTVEAFPKGDQKSAELGMTNVITNTDSYESGFPAADLSEIKAKLSMIQLMWLQQFQSITLLMFSYVVIIKCEFDTIIINAYLVTSFQFDR